MIEKNRKHLIRNVILVVVLLCLLTLGGLLIYRKSISDKPLPSAGFSEQMNDFWNYMMFARFFEYEPEVISYYLQECEAEIEELQEKNNVNYFMLQGLLYEYEQNEDYESYYEDAYAMICDSELKTNLELAIFGRSSYEVSRHLWNKGDAKAAEAIIEKMQQVFLEREAYDYLIFFNTWVAADAYEYEYGAEYSVQLADMNIAYAEKYGYQNMGYMYHCAADAYSFAGNNTMFIRTMLKAIEYYQDHNIIVFCLINIGISYLEENNYEQALQYFTKAYELDITSSEEFNIEMKYYASINLASTYSELKEYEEAQKWLATAYEWLSQEQNQVIYNDDYANYLLIEGEVFNHLEKYEDALDNFDEAKKYYFDNPDFGYSNFLISIYADTAEAYFGMKDYETALEYYLECVKLDEYAGTDNIDMYIYGMYDCYVAMKDFEHTVQCANTIQDLLEKKVKEKQSMEAEYLIYEAEKKDHQISTLNSNRERLKLFAMVISSALIISCVLIIMIRRRSHQLNKLSEEFKQLSIRDGLTNLYNRRMLSEYLSENWKNLCVNNSNISIAMFDIDYFKRYNDHYGHQKGDEVIQAVAQILLSNSKETDFVARYGGEEFIAVITETSFEETKEYLEKIQKALEELYISHEYSDVADYVSLSIGAVTISTIHYEIDYEKAIHFADDALYEAKKQRNILVQKQISGGVS